MLHKRHENEEYRDECERDGPDFADPGGRSALRRAHRGNPRNRACPTCRRRNILTPKDVARGYQCDQCADRDEGCELVSFANY